MILNSSDIIHLLELAKEAAVRAGEVIESYSKSHHRLENKSTGSSLASQVLTEVDLKAQKIIFDILKDSSVKYDLGWLDEETVDDNSRFNKDYFWCVDPLDGTLPFIECYPGYGVSIALITQTGKEVFGVVYLPHEKRLISSDNTGSIKKVDSRYLNLFCDRSFLDHQHYQFIYDALKGYASDIGVSRVVVHSNSGAVVNAISVAFHTHACYFKATKSTAGGGSLWDYAATASIFKSANLPVSNIYGNALQLNPQGSTFMNEQGVLYASDKALAGFIINLCSNLK